MRINEDMMMYTVASSAGGTGFDPCGRQGKVWSFNVTQRVCCPLPCAGKSNTCAG